MPHFVAQIVTCSISYGLWLHVLGLNEQNKYHIIIIINELPVIKKKYTAKLKRI